MSTRSMSSNSPLRKIRERVPTAFFRYNYSYKKQRSVTSSGRIKRSRRPGASDIVFLPVSEAELGLAADQFSRRATKVQEKREANPELHHQKTAIPKDCD